MYTRLLLDSPFPSYILLWWHRTKNVISGSTIYRLLAGQQQKGQKVLEASISISISASPAPCSAEAPKTPTAKTSPPNLWMAGGKMEDGRWKILDSVGGGGILMEDSYTS